MRTLKLLALFTLLFFANVCSAREVLELGPDGFYWHHHHHHHHFYRHYYYWHHHHHWRRHTWVYNQGGFYAWGN